MENQAEIKLNESAIDALRSSGKWSMFLAIMGFIGIVFMVVIAIFMTSVMSMLPDKSPANPFGLMKGFISFIYIIIAALYFPPVYYLYKYATDMSAGLLTRNSETVSNALVSLKSHHKYLGISVLVIIGLYIIGIIAFVIFFATMAKH
ncbi:MAG: hypothetical protein H7239_13300 [Flavobacterium sp.]|nr:hypothetical protein [Flavobacterium sp.]